MEKQPEEITLCKLQCVLMPQGEIICLGKTIGWFKDLKQYLELASTPQTKQQRDKLLLACKAVIGLELDDRHSGKCVCAKCIVLKAVEQAIAECGS